MSRFYDFEAEDARCQVHQMSEYAGKVVLVVNTATQCGFTPQYDDLQDMYEKYNDQGLEILDFPCNQFAGQAPGINEEIAAFCDSKFGISFKQFSKIEVNGANANPLFKFLKEQQGFKGFGKGSPLAVLLKIKLKRTDPDYKNTPDIKWNFTKFLIDREGNVVDRFEPTTDMDIVEEKVRELL